MDKSLVEQHFLLRTYEEQMNNPEREKEYFLAHHIDSFHIFEECKPKMRRGPCKKMLKVNFDPNVIQENLTFVTNAAGDSNYATV